MPLSPSTFERLSGPGLFRGMLFGGGRRALQAAERPIITATGALDSMVKAGPKPKSGVGRVLQLIQHQLMGDRPMTQLRQRYIQGGVAGRGGLIHGAVALPDEYARSIKQHGVLKASLKNPLMPVVAGAGAAGMVGLPAYAAYRAHQQGESVGRPLADGLAFMALSPLGPLGIIPAQLAGHLGEKALPGRAPPQLPPMSFNEVPPELAAEKIGTVRLGPVSLRKVHLGPVAQGQLGPATMSRR